MATITIENAGTTKADVVISDDLFQADPYEVIQALEDAIMLLQSKVLDFSALAEPDDEE